MEIENGENETGIVGEVENSDPGTGIGLVFEKSFLKRKTTDFETSTICSCGAFVATTTRKTKTTNYPTTNKGGSVGNALSTELLA